MLVVSRSVSVFTLLVLVLVGNVCTSEDLGVVKVAEVDNNIDNSKLYTTTEIIKQMVAKRCSRQYSVPCLKLDLARLIDRLSASGTNYQLLPGVSVSSQPSSNHSHPRSDDLPLELAQALARDSRSHHPLDDFLVDKVTSYLGSLTLSVKLAQPLGHLSSTSRSLTKEVIADEGRGAGRRPWNGMLVAGLFSGGTMLALALAALAAMAGKALMTAMLALLVSALAAMRGSGGGGGGGGGKTTYEIITKPVVSHEHSHSSEVQHGGHHHAYGRSMVINDKDLSETHDPMHLAYRAYSPEISMKTPISQNS